MSGLNPSTSGTGGTLEIIAFRLHGQEFCVRTTTIREIRGWGPATPIPHAPPDVIGVMNLRGTVIPIIDLANKLGMASTEPTPRSAIVVAEIHGMAMGLIVDGVSDILTVSENLLQPVPEISISPGMHYADGIIAQPDGMICFLNLERMFEKGETAEMVAA
ncbi:purine-binding chemotaxis protein CheW [Rhizobium sp. PP-F2F-G38]|uniref:chemotaxis protein CheW n=1 Tax=Rhizobium sp. PP-CC-3G-465 TaxID=2135648 RepID=UPI000D95A291|nr:purine-binding chemotaxis protein CheW [Rhizobium sp. PP-CC-3A-592]PYE32158.1 purine-binding chemotaxis protein CheW [Rhizobium sp. PP-WC-1G-195]PYE43478.1 purine-binding chemotaxis protein CheW [Rhizobium sp. PP-F2F-G20b]PYE94851.1 purine-binding chemotaxis protein CheW [Rhizobium sp. PP-F2F-G38]TCQ05330.1 purine-binding chemotaxis protein CheW [Rhizobium sp. PP-F2F-G36]TCQ25969.1 purine-binding chemotaxis protein CheW [Rhizobium sp. PP-CC-3G-465]